VTYQLIYQLICQVICLNWIGGHPGSTAGFRRSPTFGCGACLQ
jgi:hypothetical protein